MGLASFALVTAAMFVCSVQFRRNPAWHRFALPTLVWALCTVGAFFLVPVLGSDRFGVAQRVFLAVWLSWPMAVAVRARRMAGPAVVTSPVGEQALT
jgi:flagellar biosynthesis protein FliR